MAAWGVMSVFVLLASYASSLIMIALVILGEGPSSSDILPVLGPVLAAIALTLALLVARFVSSPTRVATFVLVVLAIIWGAQAFRVWSSPDWALYEARRVAWGESDVNDFRKFPQRTIANGTYVYRFPQTGISLKQEPIEYRSGGQAKQAPDLTTFLESTNTTSFIVIKDGQATYEHYFNGYSRDSIVTSFSVAKSFMSALAGIAIDEGYIGSVDDSVTMYLPELRGRGLDNVTIRHLLTMSSGIQFTGGDSIYYYPNLRSRALQIESDGLPAGAEFRYNNSLPQLLGIILERTTRRSVSQYLEEKIWQPLGSEFPASWSMDSENSGFELMQAGINARAIDFAKFGQMFLDHGSLNSRQVISPEWVTESTSPDPNDHRTWDSDQEWVEAGGYYKYFWWGIRSQDGTYDYVARGHLGQYIYVSPRNNTVIVRFGTNYGGVDNWEEVIASISASMR